MHSFFGLSGKKHFSINIVICGKH